ncbi:MAG: AAA family ATPase [Anaerolineae bacterium]
MIVAEPGVGKSMLALRTSASYLLGWPWPDGTPFRGETGMVLWCETEAGHTPNRERAKAWGLPTERILYPVENPLDSISLQDMEHMATVRYLTQRDDVKLIVVDSFSGGNHATRMTPSRGRWSRCWPRSPGTPTSLYWSPTT